MASSSKTKKYSLILDSNANKTIDSINDSLKVLNDEIQSVVIGSEKFYELSEAIVQTKKELENTTNALKPVQEEFVSVEEKARGFADVSSAIVGGFSLASQTVGLFSEESQKGFDQASKKALGYIQALQSIQAIAKGFTGDALKLFGSLKKGFADSLKAAQSFSTGTKAALIATGIGAVAIAIGLVIANWEELVALVKGSNIQDTIDANNKAIESYESTLKRINQEHQTEIKLLQTQGASEAKIFAKRKDGLQTEAALQQNALERAEENQQLLLDEQVELAERSKLVRAFLGLFGDGLEDVRAKTEASNKEVQRLTDSLKGTKDAITLVTEEFDKFTDEDALKARENDLNRQIALLSAQGNKEKEIFNLRQSSLSKEISLLNDKKRINGDLNAQDRERLANLQSQFEINKISEDKRIQLQQLDDLRNKSEIESLDKQYQINQKIVDLKFKINDIPLSIGEYQKLFNEIIKLSNDAIKAQEKDRIESNAREIQLIQDKIDKQEILESEGEKKILELRNSSVNASIKISETEYNERATFIKKAQEDLVEKLNIEDPTIGNIEHIKDSINDFLNELSSFSQAQIYEVLGSQPLEFIGKTTSEVISKINESLKKDLNPTIVKLNFDLIESVDGLEKLDDVSFGKVTTEINEVEEGLGTIKVTVEEIEPAVDNVTASFTKTITPILTISESLKKMRQDIANARLEAEENGESFKLLVDDFDAYSQEIMTGLDGIAGIALGNSQKQLEEIQKALDTTNEELDAVDERLTEQLDRRYELETLLTEASGERATAIEEELAKNADSDSPLRPRS